MQATDKEVLDTLALYHCAKIVIQFNGSGDSGQIDDITVDGLPMPAPINEINLLPAHRHLVGHSPEGETPTLYDLIETFGYDILERSSHDWYNNDGGFGDITILTGTGHIKLDMNVRITDSAQYLEDYSLEGASQYNDDLPTEYHTEK